MTRPRRSRIAFVAGLAVLGVLPLLVRRAAPDAASRCAEDGANVEASHAVTVVDGSGDTERFCGVGCARRWLESTREAPREVLVTDEVTGLAVDAGHAWFVESLVAAVAENGDHVHAFARRDDAVRHASAYRGRLLEGRDRPLPASSGAPTAAP